MNRWREAGIGRKEKKQWKKAGYSFWIASYCRVLNVSFSDYISRKYQGGVTEYLIGWSNDFTVELSGGVGEGVVLNNGLNEGVRDE